ncbi:MAG: hypothetical protein OJF51_002645 [Nitrospira sp.]|jgi:hypothetical protein|nr:MAG: hypothetical protein OJF51_002645 [Nitrospira sp.]
MRVGSAGMQVSLLLIAEETAQPFSTGVKIVFEMRSVRQFAV